MAGVIISLAEAVFTLSGLNNGLKLLVASGEFKSLEPFAKSFTVVLDAIGANKTAQTNRELTATLKEIADSMKVLQEELTGQVNKIERLLVITNFMSGEVIEAATMTELIEEVLEEPTDEKREEVMGELNRLKSPKYLATRFIQTLKTDSLNPLRVVMRTENPRTQATFTEWEQLFIDVLAQFIGVEYWKQGLQRGGDAKFKVPQAILKKSIDFRRDFLDTWRTEYQESNWNTQLLPTIKRIKNRLGPNNKAQIAEEILAELKKWVSSGHHYWVIVYGRANLSSKDKHSFEPQPPTPEYKTDRTVFSLDTPDGVNVVVHRSTLWKNQSGEKLQKLNAQLDELARRNPLPRGRQLDFADFPKKYVRSYFAGLQTPFMAMIDTRLDVTIRGTSHLGGTIPGPGATGAVSTLGRLNAAGGDGDVRMRIVVGFE